MHSVVNTSSPKPCKFMNNIDNGTHEHLGIIAPAIPTLEKKRSACLVHQKRSSRLHYFRWQAANQSHQHSLPGFDTSGSLAKVQARIGTLGKAGPIWIQAGSTSGLVVSPLEVREPVFCCANHGMLNIGVRRNHHFVRLVGGNHHFWAFGCPR